MFSSALFTDSLTVAEFGAEDASGVMQWTETEVTGCYHEITEGERRGPDGYDPAAVAFVALLPDGYGTTWSLKPGDKVTHGSRTVSVLTTSAVYNPRTLELHHVEATCG